MFTNTIMQVRVTKIVPLGIFSSGFRSFLKALFSCLRVWLRCLCFPGLGDGMSSCAEQCSQIIYEPPSGFSHRSGFNIQRNRQKKIRTNTQVKLKTPSPGDRHATDRELEGCPTGRGNVRAADPVVWISICMHPMPAG